MKTREIFWQGENLKSAQLCETKNCRLFYEVLGGTFYAERALNIKLR